VIVQKWLISLAEKGEQNLVLVLDCLQQAEQRLKDRYPDAIDLRWHAFRIKEKLRDMDKGLLAMEKVKAFLAARDAS